MSQLPILGGNPIGYFIPGFGVDEEGEIYVGTKTTLAPSALEPGGNRSGQLFKIVPATATTTLVADRDNSIYSDQTGNSNGAGELFAGRVANTPGIRRALVHFNLSSVPAGSTVTSAAVTMQVTKTGFVTSGDSSFSLHRLTRNWGEGNSVGTGTGAPAQPGEATWAQAMAGSSAWTTAGGDFITTASASRAIGNVGLYTWSSPGLAADAQTWLDTPSSSLGWILRGDEVTASAKVFGSREAASLGSRPTLKLTHTAPVSFTRREIWAGQFYLAGTPLDPIGDSDFDGIGTLLEYAWDLNPNTRQNPTDYMGVTLNGSENMATITFRRDPRATDLRYALEISGNLTSWTEVVTSTAGSAPTGSAFVSESVDPGNPQTLRVISKVPFGGETPLNRFFRLKVKR
jgi:hypothetical protein